MVKFIKTHKLGLLSAMLVLLAAALGADCGFAMAVDPVELAPEANPSENLNEHDPVNNPGGRSEESLKPDEQGGKTQLPGSATTAADIRDAGLEAEDYDKDIDNFRKFAFPIETYIARQCRPVKVNSYVHGHYRIGSSDLEAVYVGDDITITAGVSVSGVYSATTKVLTLPAEDFENAEALTEYSTIAVRGVAGYRFDQDTKEEVADGELMLFVMDHKDGDGDIKFKVVNPPLQAASGSIVASTSVIKANSSFYIIASAGSESQMRVAPESFMPEKFDVFLQKKIETVTITDEFDIQNKKVSWKTQNILQHAEENFKRKCARSHWNGTAARFDIAVPELNGKRAPVYTENGILRQIPMLYTHGSDGLTDDDLLALTTLMFTDNSMSDKATAFCGKKAIQRLIKLVNSADKYKDVGKVEVNDYGITVRNYRDNFGTLEFVWDRTLDDLGYEDYMAILDLRHATRPYKRNDTKTQRDMSKTGEAREATEYNLCRIDCVALNGFNAVLVCPSALALKAQNIGGIVANFVSVSALPDVSDDSALTPQEKVTAKTLKYYLKEADADNGFAKGDVIEWSTTLEGWVKYEGLIRS